MISNEEALARAKAALESIHRERGLRALLARGLGLKHQNISKWKIVPLEHVFAVAVIARKQPETLRPDFFGKDPLRYPKAARLRTIGLKPRKKRSRASVVQTAL